MLTQTERRAIILALCILSVPGLNQLAAQDAAYSVALQDLVKAYQRGWNAHDATAVAAFFSEDADMVMGNLPKMNGRSAIETWWDTYFQMQEPERRAKFGILSARFPTTDVALVDISSETGGLTPAGEPLVTRRARGFWSLKRHRGEWFITAMRGLPTEEDQVELVSSAETAEVLRPDIRAFARAYEDAFNAHDPAEITAFYGETAEVVVRNSPVLRGREAIYDYWTGYFSQTRPDPVPEGRWYKSMRAILIIDEIRMIAPDVALVELTATASTLHAEATPLPVRYTRATWIVVNQDGRWLIEALWVMPSEKDRVIRKTRP